MSETASHRPIASSRQNRQDPTSNTEMLAESRQPSNLNLRHNDNSFHVLASILVEFFQERVSQKDINKTLTLKPDDREILQRLLPKSAVWDFIDAVNYRLEVTPVIALSPIHFLTLQCQELFLDKDDHDKNPILITYSLEKESLSLNILEDLSNANTASVSSFSRNMDEIFAVNDDHDDSYVNNPKNSLDKSIIHMKTEEKVEEFVAKKDDDSDGFVDAIFDEASNGSDLSSDGSVIKIASSKDIAEEILSEIKTKENVDDNLDRIHGSKTEEEPINRLVSSNDEKDSGSDLSSDGSVIKIASSKDIAEEILADIKTKDSVDDIPNMTRIYENKIEEESIHKFVELNDEKGNESDVSSDGSAIIIASSKDVAEEMSAAVHDKLRESEANAEPSNSGISNSHDELVVIENIKTSIIIFPNEDSAIVADKHTVPDISPMKNVQSFEPEKVILENDDGEEGEEIEVLPTLTYSNDEVTYEDTELSPKCDASGAYDELPTIINNKADGTSGSQEKNENLEGQHEYILDTSFSQNPAAENGNQTFQLNDCSKNNIEKGSDHCSNDIEHSRQEDKENGAATLPTGDSKVGNVIVSEMSSDRPTISPVNDYANKTVASFNSVSRSIQEAAGTFFEDIRWAIDEKIIAFEDAVADAIVAKPMKKDRFDFQLESTTCLENSTDHESCSVSKQQAFESIVREKIPDSEPQKRIRHQCEEPGLTSFFGGITTGFSPTVSEKMSHNGLAFPSDEGSAIGSHLSIPDLTQYDSMIVVDVATKQQLLLETKEALTLMKQSITPETTRFWRDHIQSLQNRLDSLRVVSAQNVNTIDVALPIDSRNIDFGNRQTNKAVELWSRDSPTEMSDVRSIFGIPVVPGFFQFSDASTAQDDSSGKLAPTLKTPTIHITPRENTIGLETSPPANPEIELCQRGSSKDVRAEMAPPEIEPFDSDYEYPLVDVVAPADLPGGYHFEAEIEGLRFLATVPPGGVQQGETFTCYMRELDSVAIDIPVGDWKDGLCNMCDLGWCHPVLWNALFCPLIALSQIQTRVSLDFLGRPKFSDLPYSNRFMMLTVVGFWLFTNVGLFVACNVKWSHGLELSVADICAFVLVNVAMFGFVVFVTQSTRSSVREKFMIRERQCYDLEDVCCATLCLPCTVGQMSRHTANYDDYEAVCCSKTGLPNGVRVNQEPAKVKETTTENKDGYMV